MKCVNLRYIENGRGVYSQVSTNKVRKQKGKTASTLLGVYTFRKEIRVCSFSSIMLRHVEINHSPTPPADEFFFFLKAKEMRSSVFKSMRKELSTRTSHF